MVHRRRKTYGLAPILSPSPEVHMHRRRMAALAVPLVAAAATPAFADSRPATSTGPSTTTPPYVIPVADGVHISSLLTVDDGAASNGYELDGMPDGLGAQRVGAQPLHAVHEPRVQRAHRDDPAAWPEGRVRLEVPDRPPDPRGRDRRGPDRSRRAVLGLRRPALPGHRVSRRARTRASPATCSPPRATRSRASARRRSAPGGSSRAVAAIAATTAASTSPTRRTATRAARSACSRTARPSSCRASGCSRGRTRCRRTTARTPR